MPTTVQRNRNAAMYGGEGDHVRIPRARIIAKLCCSALSRSSASSTVFRMMACRASILASVRAPDAAVDPCDGL